MGIFYECLRAIFSAIFSVFFRYRVTGKENLPKQGGYIIAANHLSLWDPPLVATPIPAHLHYMAKQELFQIPVFSAIIRGLGTFPVKRATADRLAIRTAINLLKAGEVVGIFPEGTRSKNGKLQKPEAGLELIASKAGVPVIPVAIMGTNLLFRNGNIFPRFEVHFGKAIYPSDKNSGPDHINLTAQVMQSIQNMLDFFHRP
ncbi:1-acyl-sn-glycerol-3-phosphate acyltransferase [Sporomusaceae bacterium BoRhaA]|uniref:lysophospholipid acyltransferase family protein n=1 Tax=Pelorhabdus rhamnosifermentans TaxID=2772457 RepID=UPI001C060C79|nr:lysophospholipid acyltransferase family protein [Pelorhabdus rhamnosifermentans]MBU2701025.1 1-acyl-sn-glycerol-3-phosphate acyltransferase [Pelorhabdus rhamnosifermentans]